MNRWMTRLALPAKCPGCGASGFVAARAAVPALDALDPKAAARAKASVSNDARAIFPTPTPHSRKKCRRVMCRRFSCCRFIVVSLALRHRFIEIHDTPRYCGPGGALDHV